MMTFSVVLPFEDDNKKHFGLFWDQQRQKTHPV